MLDLEGLLELFLFREWMQVLVKRLWVSEVQLDSGPEDLTLFLV